PSREPPLTVGSFSVDRGFLIISTICFLAAVVRTFVSLRAGTFRPGGFNFLAIGLGFILQTAFLSIRGHELGRCPLTNLFEVFIFLAWSIGLIYMLVGPAYRLSVMGGFRTLYAWAGEWLFYWPAVAARANGLRLWGLDPVRSYFARQTSAPAGAETCGRAQHSRI